MSGVSLAPAGSPPTDGRASPSSSAWHAGQLAPWIAIADRSAGDSVPAISSPTVSASGQPTLDAS
jgi:hypothetical protein